MRSGQARQRRGADVRPVQRTVLGRVLVPSRLNVADSRAMRLQRCLLRVAMDGTHPGSNRVVLDRQHGSDGEWVAIACCARRLAAPVAGPRSHCADGVNTMAFLLQRTGETACEKGYTCQDGVRSACPAGRYGNVEGISDPQCSGPCDAGFVCASGSSAPNADDPDAGALVSECGSPSVYCPSGSASPRLVSTGYFSTPDDAAGARRSGQAICVSGCVARA